MRHHPLRAARRPLALVAGLAAGAVVVLTAGCAAGRLHTAAQLARDSEPLQARPAQPTLRLLIVGDSTAVGTGASSAQASVAGLIAQAHPDWTIVNRGSDGATFDEVARALAVQSQRFDIVLMLAGGNDVIRLRGSDEMRRDTRAIALRARDLAPRVILMPPGNVGNAPFFFPPWSWWMSSRARAMHAAVRDAARATGATYVNLYQDKANDPFAQEPERLHAADGLHPSDDGYRLWHQELTRQAQLPP
jgi:lysophospholipase L1-like esterase